MLIASAANAMHELCALARLVGSDFTAALHFSAVKLLQVVKKSLSTSHYSHRERFGCKLRRQFGARRNVFLLLPVTTVVCMNASSSVRQLQRSVSILCNLGGARLDLRHKTAIFHITKEIDGIAPFGGVGKVIHELVRSQRSKREIVVVLPKYGFLRGVEISQISIRHNNEVSGDVFYVKVENIHYVLIGPPSTCPPLWQSLEPNNMYTIPKKCSRAGFSREDRDLYFTFMAAYFMLNLNENVQYTTTPSSHHAIVHVHSSHNAPFLAFYKSGAVARLKNTKLMYTMHDYVDELRATYTQRAIFRYFEALATTVYSSNCTRTGCLDKLTFHLGRVSVYDILKHADVITAVSYGMITDMKSLSPTFSNWLRTAGKNLTVINNWVSDVLLSDARSRITMLEPSSGKLQAKSELAEIVGRIDFESSVCVVSWLGRFDSNKGVNMLHTVYKTACSNRCMMIVMGQHTSDAKDEKIFERQLHLIRKSSYSRTCPFLLIDSPELQRKVGLLVRAASDVTMITSVREAFGLVAAESLAFASIPIAPAVGGLVDIIKPYGGFDLGWNGFLYRHTGSPQVLSVRATFTLNKCLALLRELKRTQRTHNDILRRLITTAPISAMSKPLYDGLVERLLDEV